MPLTCDRWLAADLRTVDTGPELRRQAQVAALFYLEDRPIAEIAQILRMATGTVKKHLHDGRKTLARALELDEVNDERE